MKRMVSRGMIVGIMLGVVAAYAQEPESTPTALGLSPGVDDEVPELADFALALGGRDPLEGFNRVVYHGTNTFIRYLFRPAGTVYGSIVPRWGVTRVNRFTDNLEFLVRGGSCLLQARFEDGGIEGLRFLTNTTVGVAGLFEVAEGWGLPRQAEDFGQAFASWGIGPGFSLYAMGPTNLRDAFGSIFDYALDPKSYIYGGQAFTLLNEGVESYPQYDRVWRESFDPYWTFREFKLIERHLKIENWSPATPDPDYVPPRAATSGGANVPEALRTVPLAGAWQGAVVDTLRVGLFKVQRDKVSAWAYLSLFNSDFEHVGSVASVRVGEEGESRPAMRYKYWRQDDPAAPLVVVLPGLGSHYSGTTGAAFAELLHGHGHAVAVMSNGLNWEFVEAATRERLPGFAPDDAVAVRHALGRLLADLRERHSLAPAQVSLAGVSLGALHTLLIADMERREPRLGIGRYLAVNPPVDLMHGMMQLDDFFAVGAGWDEADTVARVTDAVGRYLAMVSRPWSDCGEGGETVPIGEDNAKFLIGYAFRRNLRELLASLHHRGLLSRLETPYRWGDRQRLYHELDRRGFHWYISAELIPYYARKWGRIVTMEELNRLGGLRNIAAALREDERIRVVHAGDDFLVLPEDRQFLQEVFGDRIVFFDHGAHLGNLYLAAVQRAMLAGLGVDFVVGEVVAETP